MINFNQLRVFYHAARHESFTIASQKLCVTQPAITSQIKLFEEYCSLKLFKKKGRKVYLTDEGKLLYTYAGKVFEYEKQIDDAIEDLRFLKRGVLRLGTTKAYARYFMPTMLAGFHEVYPQIKLHLDEGSSMDMIQSLLDLKTEIAIIAQPVEHPDICFTPFSKEELILITSASHPFTYKKSISFEELSDEPIIMKEIGSGTRKVVNELFSRNNAIPNILMETGNTEFIKQLVERGEGISFLVREVVKDELQQKKLASVPIKDENTFLEVSIAYLKNQHLSPVAKAFLDILKKLRSTEMSHYNIGSLMAKMLASRAISKCI